MKKIILDLCGGTGSWSEPYKEAGYAVVLITLPEYNILKAYTDGTNIHFPHSTMPETVIPFDKIYGILAAPPCTEFSLAKGNSSRNFTSAMRVVEACFFIIWSARANGSLQFWALENPTGFLRQFLGKPPFTFFQWEFGGEYVKRTDLWGYYKKPKVQVKIKPQNILAGEKHTSHSKQWSNPKKPDKYKDLKLNRAAIRAITPPGFARAFMEANP